MLALWLFRVDIVGDLCQMAWEFFKHRHGLGSGFLKMRVKKRSNGSRSASFGLRTLMTDINDVPSLTRYFALNCCHCVIRQGGIHTNTVRWHACLADIIVSPDIIAVRHAGLN